MCQIHAYGSLSGSLQAVKLMINLTSASMIHILYIQWVDHVSGNMWIFAMEEGVSPECVSVSEGRAVEQCSLQCTHLAYTVDFLCLSWVTSFLFCKSWKERHWHTWVPSRQPAPSSLHFTFTLHILYTELHLKIYWWPTLLKCICYISAELSTSADIS